MRVLFIIAAVVMLVTLPFFYNRIPALLQFSLLAIAVLVVIAGFTTPRHRAVAVANPIVAVIGVLIFGGVAVDAYRASGWADPFFWTNRILAFDFLIALYFATKTVREMTAKPAAAPRDVPR